MTAPPAPGAETEPAGSLPAAAETPGPETPRQETPSQETPRLALAGFEGPLERFLELARAERIDLAGISLADLLAQLIAALARAAPLAAKGEWVVMAAWLLLLRSRLLLPRAAPGQQAAEASALDLRARLLRLRDARGLAAWLDRRPQPGRDFFFRGRASFAALAEAAPETESGAAAAPAAAGEASAAAIDVIEFLWASLGLFDDDLPAPDTAARYRPRLPDLHDITQARARILRLLAGAPEGRKLDALLPVEPAAPAAAPEMPPSPRRRSAWSSTFVASLELARQGQVTLSQEAAFTPIRVTPAPA